MSFLYPRIITISRPVPVATVGAQGYSGVTKTNETVIASGIAASIQLQRPGGAPSGALPADTEGRGMWRVYFKGALGTVLERDVVTDDLGNRYQVTNAYWDSLGYNLLCERLLT